MSVENQSEYSFYKLLTSGEFAGCYALDTSKLSGKNNFSWEIAQERQSLLDAGHRIIEIPN